MEKSIDEQTERLQAIIPNNIYGFDNDTLAGNIGKILTERGRTLATAESCTGGNIAHLITLNPGSSKYFNGTVVAYSNNVKTNILNIDKELIEQHGAVSREVAEAMARQVRILLKTDYGVATTGIAGPDGGTETKPVGTVWIAVTDGKIMVSKCFNSGPERDSNITRASQTALNLLRNLIVD